jgi:hypothetical protein
LRPCKLLWGNVNDVVRHRLSAAEDIGRHGRRRDVFVRVVDIVDVPNIDDVFYICDVPDIGDVHLAKIVRSVVIPREEGIARS